MSRRLAALALLSAVSLVCAVSAFAADVLRVRAPSGLRIAPGASTHIAIQVVVKPGYHVQANPVENPNLIPIVLALEATEGISVGQALYPAAKRLRLPGDSQDLVVYDGTFAISVPVQVASGAQVDTTKTLKGTLHYQACDERHCLFPVTLPVAISLTVGEP